MEVKFKNKSYQRTCTMRLVQLYRRTRGHRASILSDIPSQGHLKPSVFGNQPTMKYIEALYDSQ